MNTKTKQAIGGLSVLMLCVLVGYVAIGLGTSPMTYPVEDFSHDAAYPVLRVIDGDTVEIQYIGKSTTVRLKCLILPKDEKNQKSETRSEDKTVSTEAPTCDEQAGGEA